MGAWRVLWTKVFYEPNFSCLTEQRKQTSAFLVLSLNFNRFLIVLSNSFLFIETFIKRSIFSEVVKCLKRYKQEILCRKKFEILKSRASFGNKPIQHPHRKKLIWHDGELHTVKKRAHLFDDTGRRYNFFSFIPTSKRALLESNRQFSQRIWTKLQKDQR